VKILGGGHLGQVRALRGVLRDFAPDAALSAIAASPLKLTLAARGMDVTLIHAFHGFDEWRTGRLSWLTWKLLPWISRRSAAIVAVSEALRRSLVEDWGAPEEKTARIYNPVALPDPLPDASDLGARAPLVLAIGRLSREKGHGLLLKAFAHMRTPDARLAVLGEGPQRAHLEELARNLGIAERVDFAGWQADVWPWLNRARVLALPSRTESFGNVVVEALAAGLPVVSTDTPGPREILGGDARLGALTPVTEPQEMADALDAWLANPGDPAPRQARALDFSAQRGVAEWEKLILEHARG
jgi:glycosyltransferase involved in cell wall biosynthesis